MMNQVLAALLHPAHVLALVLIRHRTAWHRDGRTAVTLEGADGGHDHGAIRLEAGVAALQVPELLKADVCTKAGLSDVVICQLESHAVSDD